MKTQCGGVRFDMERLRPKRDEKSEYSWLEALFPRGFSVENEAARLQLYLLCPDKSRFEMISRERVPGPTGPGGSLSSLCS